MSNNQTVVNFFVEVDFRLDGNWTRIPYPYPSFEAATASALYYSKQKVRIIKETTITEVVVEYPTK